MLVAGNVIIGRREENDPEAENSSAGARDTRISAEGSEGYDDAGEVLLGDELEMEDEVHAKNKQVDEDILDLGLDPIRAGREHDR